MDFNDIAIEWKKGIIIFGIVLALSACDNMAVASSTTANGASSVSESVKEDTAKVANETKEKAENDAKKA
ncbi:Uncharacterised protein [Leminorella richardii]|uniref:Uncharacterized protein n=1 Tax=Leminorella richardii TaxID=158841 RepID=A0A2X4Y720_9GAMM|nr:hypothetical protein [Leminorella richardii]SQI44284.1 Uncharacterised protein [Leminorella richardii]